MELKDTLEIFSRSFVKKPYRYRCVHDALKKPGNLMKKVCHGISDVFEPRFENGSINVDSNDPCYLFDLNGHMEKTTWGNAMIALQGGGGGFLIIDRTGCKFYAESEGEPPPVKYAGADS